MSNKVTVSYEFYETEETGEKGWKHSTSYKLEDVIVNEEYCISHLQTLLYNLFPNDFAIEGVYIKSEKGFKKLDNDENLEHNTCYSVFIYGKK
jgi:hypothetical protein